MLLFETFTGGWPNEYKPFIVASPSPIYLAWSFGLTLDAFHFACLVHYLSEQDKRV